MISKIYWMKEAGLASKSIGTMARPRGNDWFVVIHCRMGIGRSSMLAAAILIHLGMESSNIFERISTYRGLQVPDTPAQTAWISQLVTKLEGG